VSQSREHPARRDGPRRRLEAHLNLRDYLPLLVFFAGGLAVGGAILGLSMLGPKRPSAIKSLPYESGILATTPARQRFSIDFYLTAMLFIVFDVELAFFYPHGGTAVVELIVFVTVLGAALGYIWRRGALEWR
jgi:NADH-quinone oxidoreductase subunit A